ncbi:alpha/beta fold hydrolase [Parasphingopyxis marina]|uniref:Alpha/beta hydrolase n=1 Tax=Parasphingopyxis marina TaxID=2761622 RepID=A0A842HVC1_9SPHN|nr:alpha/beta hydrolase [Parasphingopyxis marina]MBC2777036.1 alpha/beta hydrolase [Parasphingopyxis marina]
MDKKNHRQGNLERRTLLSTIGAIGLGAAISLPARAKSAPPHRLPAQTEWDAEPPQAPAHSGHIAIEGGRLYYWDTGGDGPAIVLLHANTGSAMTWGYQQPVMANAGYRVIGYSRWGHQGSEFPAGSSLGSAVDDLRHLLDALEINRCHIVATAAGGFTAADFAILHPDRLHSLTIASSWCGITDPDFVRVSRAILPPGFHDLPPEFREVGPSYRAGNPAGTARWIELQRAAIPGDPVRQPRSVEVTPDTLARLPFPILLMTGDADLYMPPSLMRDLAARLPNAEMVGIGEAGHAAYWEQPRAFNRAVLEFIGG